MKTTIAAALLGLFALPALAVDASMQLVLTLEGNAQRDVVVYECDGAADTFAVQYINAHPVFLAIVPVEEGDMVFANVVSASGARYAAGQYIWWTQGNDATLYSALGDEDEELLSCHAAVDIP